MNPHRVATAVSRLMDNEIFRRNAPSLIAAAMDVSRYPDGEEERTKDDRVFLHAVSTIAGLSEEEEAVAWFRFWLGFDPENRAQKVRLVRSAARHFGFEARCDEDLDEWLSECGRAAFIELGWDQWRSVAPISWCKVQNIE